jgi:hypothetical protein
MKTILVLAFTVLVGSSAYAKGHLFGQPMQVGNSQVVPIWTQTKSKPLLSKSATERLSKNISNKIGDGGPVEKLALHRQGKTVTFSGKTFLGPGGGMVPFKGKASLSGKIISFSSGQPE